MLNIRYPEDLQRSIQKYSMKPISIGNRDQMTVGINEQQWYDIVHRCAVFEKRNKRNQKYIQDKCSITSINQNQPIELDHRDYYEPVEARRSYESPHIHTQSHASSPEY